VPASNDNFAASYPVTFPFQYLNNDQPGPNALGGTINTAPFGEFARNSDLLQIPYVGAYRIFDSNGNLLELNAMPMDCSFAEDTDLSDDPPVSDVNVTGTVWPYYQRWESVGHFLPIETSNNSFTPPQGPTDLVADADPSLGWMDGSATPDAFTAYKAPDQTALTPVKFWWRYRWASRLLDYLSVQNPNDDYLPNIAPSLYASGLTPPAGVVNSFISANFGNGTNHYEDTVPTHGLININTAPWRVLAALRFCPFDEGDNSVGTINGVAVYAPQQFYYDRPTFTFRQRQNGDPPMSDNTALAMAIADYRDRVGSPTKPQTYDSTHTGTTAYQFATVKGPFNSLSDLLSVPAVATYLQQVNFVVGGAEPDVGFGHFSPSNVFNAAGQPLTDGVRNDAEERFDFISRISNQATVRSDTFTVYIVVQGWRNAGSTNPTSPPQLVTQKRAAFFVDRSSVNPTNSEPRVYNIPTD
ncbi:MAG: hypothetical protein JO353_00725, partial [Phycisphaerae bacterium]|nr:hypothetical protein [Phycisphaerae bacterium]